MNREQETEKDPIKAALWSLSYCVETLKQQGFSYEQLWIALEMAQDQIVDEELEEREKQIEAGHKAMMEALRGPKGYPEAVTILSTECKLALWAAYQAMSKARKQKESEPE